MQSAKFPGKTIYFFNFQFDICNLQFILADFSNG